MRTEPTHQAAWAGALLCFILFTGLFFVGGDGLVHYFRAVTFGASVALFCIGFTLLEREKDEPVFDAILAEREDRLSR